jgi:O-antigen/teichoic acid export membrane protein
VDLFQKLCGIKDQSGRPIESKKLKGMYKQSLNIAWPSTIEGALLSIIGSIDTMMVGTLGAAAIAAVGLTSQPRMILLICAQSLCVGTTALCARRKGADDQPAANSCLNQSLALVTVLGVVMALLGYYFAEPLMRLAGANEDTMAMSVAFRTRTGSFGTEHAMSGGTTLAVPGLDPDLSYVARITLTDGLGSQAAAQAAGAETLPAAA